MWSWPSRRRLADFERMPGWTEPPRLTASCPCVGSHHPPRSSRLQGALLARAVGNLARCGGDIDTAARERHREWRCAQAHNPRLLLRLSIAGCVKKSSETHREQARCANPPQTEQKYHGHGAKSPEVSAHIHSPIGPPSTGLLTSPTRPGVGGVARSGGSGGQRMPECSSLHTACEGIR